MKKFFACLLIKKIVVMFFLFTFITHQQAVIAQPVPVVPAANFAMNRAVGGILVKVAVKRGFAANDPRIAATLANTGNVMSGLNVASTVAGVGLAVAGAPVWLTLAAGLGLFAVGAAITAGKTIIRLENNAVVVDASSSISSRSDIPMGLHPADVPWQAQLLKQTNIYRLSDCFPTQACYFYKPLPNDIRPFQKNFQSPDTRFGSVAFVYYSLQELTDKYLPLPKTYVRQAYTLVDTFSWSENPHFETSDSGIVRLIGKVAYERKCLSGLCTFFDQQGIFFNPDDVTMTPMIRQWDSVDERIIIDPVARPYKFKSLDEAAQQMPDIAKNEILASEFIAKIVDQAWMKAASKPNYQGVPYVATQPVSVADVNAWVEENPNAQPKVSDLLTPASDTGTSVVPISQTVAPSQTSQSPNSTGTQSVNVVNAPKVDLGADPGIAAPSIDQPPGLESSLYPLFSLFPELKNYVAPSHSSVCPKPSFSAFGKTFTMESHCTLADNNRLTIASVMSVVWTIAGLFILLSA